MNDLFRYKIASEKWEFEQIKRLNYETFVEEIPQHRANSEGILADKFHDENTYFICVNENSVIGMLAIRNKRPFSLDQKLENLNLYLPNANSVCEVRLLSVKKQFRRSRISFNLLIYAARYCEKQGYDLAVISAILNQRKLYEHMGFKAFGPIVGTPGASFQPMYLTLKDYQEKVRPLLQMKEEKFKIINFLPGPVEISAEIKNAFNKPAISHRSNEYFLLHKETQRGLCKMTGADHAEIFMGTGTLANDVIAGQMSLHDAKGLILSNGEFGNRLIKQAKRFNLKFETLEANWGQRFSFEEVNGILHDDRAIKWLWMTHCETSTGMLNDIEMMKNICKRNAIRLCLDCISSIGMIDLNLQDVYLASAVSGKGLGSFSGLAMIFYNHQLSVEENSLPAYLDLAYYAQKGSVPFTISSNLVNALNTAVKNLHLEKRFANVSAISNRLKNEFRKSGIYTVIPDIYANPYVITVKIPAGIDSEYIGEQFKEKEIWVSYNSDYLLERNWIQICMMSEYSEEEIQFFINAFQRIFNSRPYIPAVEDHPALLKMSDVR